MYSRYSGNQLPPAVAAPQRNPFENLFGGNRNRDTRPSDRNEQSSRNDKPRRDERNDESNHHNNGSHSEPRQGNILENLGGLDLGGIANLLRSGGGGISKILQEFSINWDSGDILMVLILLFLSLESDDDEILILLALVLVMGL